MQYHRFRIMGSFLAGDVVTNNRMEWDGKLITEVR